MQESWIELDEFPGYAVSTDGRVINTNTDVLKQPSLNQQGHAIVNLHKEGKQHVRSVSVLVAQAFLDHSRWPDHFDTPIHLNGEKLDCRIENMDWRPRWFAIKYHQQFNPVERAKKFGFRNPVEILETSEVFDTSWDAAIRYGFLDQEIFIATVNRAPVFPHWYNFRVLEE